eukprot:sb/3469261/
MGNIPSCNGTSVKDNNETSYNDYIGNLTALENSRTTMLYVILPPALLGIALNILCLVFFLRRERKGIGNQLLIGLVASDLSVCLSSPALLSLPVNQHSLIGAKVFDALAGFSYIGTQLFMLNLWYLRVITIYKPLARIKPRNVWIYLAVETLLCLGYAGLIEFVLDISDYFSGGEYFPLKNLEILSWEPTETSKQPIRTRYLGLVTGYQPIRDQYFLMNNLQSASIVVVPFIFIT